eukprot:scpid10628/ scgid20791/ 
MLLSAGQTVSAIKYCIIPGHEQLRARAIQLLSEHEQLDIAEDDTSLSELIISNQMAAGVAATPFWATHVRHMARLNAVQDSTDNGQADHSGGSTAVATDDDAVAKELCDADRPVEAGSVLMSLRNTAGALATFDASLSMVSSWWSGAGSAGSGGGEK